MPISLYPPCCHNRESSNPHGQHNPLLTAADGPNTERHSKIQKKIQRRNGITIYTSERQPKGTDPNPLK